jgi:arylsulfatase A-like enzyme
MHRYWLAFLAMLSAALPAFADDTAASPNFVFILADDMRPDCLGALGHPVVKTPHLDALVRDGLVFTHAVAAYPICNVSRAEILSGTTAFRNGVGYRGNAIDPALKTWAGTLREAGYLTWYCGKWHNDGRPINRGYVETCGLFTSGGAPKDGLPPPDHAGRKATGYTGWTFKTDGGKVELEKGVGLTPDTDRYIADGAVELVRRGPDRPFFLHVSFTAPHDPRLWPRGYQQRYDPATIPLPPSFRPQHPFDHGNLSGRDELLLPKPLKEPELREELAVYYACISNLDEQLGRIIAALRETGQLKRTVIIFSSDQGLALGSHGLLGKQNLYEHTFRVPLIFCGPGVPRGRRSAADCYLRDLFPTTCNMAGVAIPQTVESRSLTPLFRDDAPPNYDFVVGYFTDTQRAIRKGPWKLICYPQAGQIQLFNLQQDGDELHDLAARPEHAATVRRLRVELATWLQQHGDTQTVLPAPPPATR